MEVKTPPVTVVKEAKQTLQPAMPAASQPSGPRWPAADEPFIGADGRIRR
jgi:hypothetical protein